MEFFRKCEHWVPGVAGQVLDVLVDIPEARVHDLYDLAEQFGRGGTLYGEHLKALADLQRELSHWRGDDQSAARMALARLTEHMEKVKGEIEASAEMQELVSSNAVSIETMKLLALGDIVMFAVAVVMFILTVIETLGLASGGLAAAYLALKEGIAQAAKELVE